MAGGYEHRRFSDPDQTREFPFGRAVICTIGGREAGLYFLEPGWRLADHGGSAAAAGSPDSHLRYHIGGLLTVRLGADSGFTAGPGDLTALSGGHDAWVTGDDPVIMVDWTGASLRAG